MRACAILLVLAACGSQYHVRLDPPRSGITPQERVELFWKRRPTAQWQVTSEGQLLNQTMVLGDEQPGVEEVEVVSPEDLEPLVGPDSETMQHARRSVAARHKARRWSRAAAAVLIAGFVGGIALSQTDSSWKWVSFGGGFVGSAVLYMFQREAAREELTWRRQAFRTYTRDLGTFLNVCAHGTKVVPCEEPTPSEPTPPAPKPEATTRPGQTALLRMR
jgi:hypothetical protein